MTTFTLRLLESSANAARKRGLSVPSAAAIAGQLIQDYGAEVAEVHLREALRYVGDVRAEAAAES